MHGFGGQIIFPDPLVLIDMLREVLQQKAGSKLSVE